MTTWLVMIVMILIIASGLYFGLQPLIRALARIPFRWTFNPANTFAIVVTEKNTVNNSVTGGNIKNVLHAIPGKQLVKPGKNEMEWRFENGEDPTHQNFLFQKLGVQDMGSVFYKLRTNVDKRERYARDTDKPDTGLQTIAKKMETEHVYFSGEMQLTIKGVDTADRVALTMKVNLVFERTYPVRSVLRLADTPAFLESEVEEIVNNETSIRPVTAYYGGQVPNPADPAGNHDPTTKENRVALAKAIDDDDDFKKQVLNDLGLTITAVTLHDVDAEQKYKDLLAKRFEALKEAEATTIRVEAAADNTVKTAEAENKAQMLLNAADADRVARVFRPMARNNRTVAIAYADAYRNNQTVRVYAPGRDTMLPLTYEEGGDHPRASPSVSPCPVASTPAPAPEPPPTPPKESKRNRSKGKKRKA